MKTRKKSKAMMIITAVIAVLLLVPFPVRYKDGGTVKYRAALYCVTKRHELAAQGGYYVGTEIEILFFKVYSDVEFIPKDAR